MMHKRLSLLLLVLTLVLGITSFQLVSAKNVPAAPSIDLASILADAKTQINAMPASDQVKAKLYGLMEDGLQNAVKNGFMPDQIWGLEGQMLYLARLIDLENDVQSLKACYALMIKAMQDGATAEQIAALIAENLATGADPREAAREAQSDIKDNGGIWVGEPC